MPAELGTGFLVAAPSLLDPNFHRAVVLLTAHKPEGSLGFIVNRPSELSFRDVVTELGIKEDGQPIPDVPVLSGGPVAPETGWLVFDPSSNDSDDDEDNILTVSSKLHISTSREMLEAVALQDEASRHLLVLGYAGWGAGQLDGEIKQGAWIPVDLDEEIVFATPMEERWTAALESLGIDPRQIVGMPLAQA